MGKGGEADDRDDRLKSKEMRRERERGIMAKMARQGQGRDDGEGMGEVG